MSLEFLLKLSNNSQTIEPWILGRRWGQQYPFVPYILLYCWVKLLSYSLVPQAPALVLRVTSFQKITIDDLRSSPLDIFDTFIFIYQTRQNLMFTQLNILTRRT